MVTDEEYRRMQRDVWRRAYDVGYDAARKEQAKLYPDQVGDIYFTVVWELAEQYGDPEIRDEDTRLGTLERTLRRLTDRNQALEQENLELRNQVLEREQVIVRMQEQLDKKNIREK